MNSVLLIFLSFLVYIYCGEEVQVQQQQELSSQFLDHEIEGYYWREYYGYIPHDAVPGGFDLHEHPTYIGQTLHKSMIIPGEIDAYEKQINYAWGYKPFSANKNVKILCSNHQEQLEWVSTDNELIKHLTSKHLILGGYEAAVGDNFIGRKSINGTTIVGKVLISDKSFSGLHINNMAKPFQFHSFEILIFNPYLPPKKSVVDKTIIAIGEHGEIEYGLRKAGCPKNIVHLNFNHKKDD